ncbi:hypothetical protein D623_10006057 [Myotis brandtii]|uniref:Uncharacterized protein n=1 Tax=Myotis brandtii TaxID=109478 RepID=S7NQY8_MYOBR|nr:hypothetical protein D623_10006057 [Myotis brandtii]
MGASEFREGSLLLGRFLGSRHVSGMLLSREHQPREQPASSQRAAASCGLPLSKEQQLCERPASLSEEEQPRE